MSHTQYFEVDCLIDAASAIFVGAGVAPVDARIVAANLVESEARGVPSHGLMLLPMYLDRLRDGSVIATGRGEVVSDQGAVSVLDAGHRLGQVTGVWAMELAIGKARSFGLGAVAVRNAFHFGGAFSYAVQAANQGMIGIAAANTRPLMPAPGGAKAVVGNNPLAFAVPQSGGSPIVLDMALSEAALGKIRLAAAEGREIPPTWASDVFGVPTTDPSAALAGLLLPMGGPKGYGLALIVDLLTGALSGGGFGQGVRGLYADTAVPNNAAHFFLALDPSRFSVGFDERAKELASEIKASPTAPGVDCVFLPGEIEDQRAQAARTNGIRLEATVFHTLLASAKRVGVTTMLPV
ncbi:Ldh family oxidoreductase [Paenarthrobacter sp. NPDC056912]|uniref:Ldh family oxidoreductase n=1 Tax=Paenarthrobacter sp. NPDC056912 TaxID=3345965 RepID=UPI00366CD54A